MWQLVFASRHRLIPQQEEQQEEQEDAKRVPDGHGRSFGSGPWQKQIPLLLILDNFGQFVLFKFAIFLVIW